MLAPHPDQRSDGSFWISVTSIFINHLFNHLFAVFELSRNPKPTFRATKNALKSIFMIL